MGTNHPAYDVPQQHRSPEQITGLMEMAERELGAFLSAVGRKFGSQATYRAGNYWMEAFEAASRPLAQRRSNLRFITLAAASRLARDGSEQ